MHENEVSKDIRHLDNSAFGKVYLDRIEFDAAKVAKQDQMIARFLEATAEIAEAFKQIEVALFGAGIDEWDEEIETFLYSGLPAPDLDARTKLLDELRAEYQVIIKKTKEKHRAK